MMIKSLRGIDRTGGGNTRRVGSMAARAFTLQAHRASRPGEGKVWYALQYEIASHDGSAVCCVGMWNRGVCAVEKLVVSRVCV